MSIWMLWFIAGVLLIILEIFTASFFISLIGAACILTGFVAIFANSLILQICVFIFSGLFLLIFIRPFFLRFLSKTSKPSNINALTGKEFQVTTTIDNKINKGYIKSGGDYWRAKSLDDSIIEEGEFVIVDKMEGNTVFVRKKQNSELV